MRKFSILILAGALALVFGVIFLVKMKNKDVTPALEEEPTQLSQNAYVLSQPEPQSSASVVKQEPSASSSVQINVKKVYFADVLTSVGMIRLELNMPQTPKTVSNFINLAQKHFYDNTIFHRVIKGFMIQGGDPKGDGSGGPGYSFDDEPFAGEYLRGTLAMANAGRNTNGSQFFIMHEDNTSLPKNYVIFGKVSSGIEVVDEIADAEVGPNAFGENSKPLNPVIIKSVTIKEK